jgi:hypothetical protein
MGDRGNIVIEKDGKPVLYFYTHWTGSRLPSIVAAGLEHGRGRWGDSSYLNRALFQTLIEGDGGILGYGISSTMGDGGTEVYIDHDKKRVSYNDTGYTFESFIAKYQEVTK